MTPTVMMMAMIILVKLYTNPHIVNIIIVDDNDHNNKNIVTQ